MTKLEIAELKRENEKAWDSYVHNSDSSTFYHQIGWRNVIEKTYKHKSVYLIAKEEEFLMRSMLFGKKLVSVPFGPYGGVCADNETVKDVLIDEAKRIAEDRLEAGDKIAITRRTGNTINLSVCRTKDI
jgi:hypothetical protein